MTVRKTTILAFTIVFLLSAAGLNAQDDPPGMSKQFKTPIMRLLANNKTVSLLLKDLLEVRGKVVSYSDAEFAIRFKNKEGKIIRKSILFSNILELNGGGENMSVVPVVTKNPHGSWDDVGQVFPGTKILIKLTDGRYVTGYSNSVNPTHLVLLDRRAEKKLDLPRNEIAAFIAFTISRGGAKKGAKWAAKELYQAPILGAIGVGVGALIGALTKVDGRAILIFSR